MAEQSARVLVIDDASPDGTGERADELAENTSFLDVLHRSRKEGLGPAYIAGFKAQRYQVELPDGFTEAKSVMANAIAR